KGAHCQEETDVNALKILSRVDAKIQSTAFEWYTQKLHAALRDFNKQLQMCDKNISDVWTDPRFGARFLFNLQVQGEEPIADPTTSWITCCWNMREMLERCQNVSFVKKYLVPAVRGRRFMNSFTQNLWLDVDPSTNIEIFQPTTMFAISAENMTAYLCGQLLLPHFPQLQAIMRASVKDECKQIYFPAFHSFTVTPPNAMMTLQMCYDFCALYQEVPRASLQGCPIQGVCYFPCDGPMLRLFDDPLQKMLFACTERQLKTV